MTTATKIKNSESVIKIHSFTIKKYMKSGIAPWSRSQKLYRSCRLPYSAKTGELYEGSEILNRWLLEYGAIEKDWVSSCWATREEWSDLGFKVFGKPTKAIKEVDESLHTADYYNADQLNSRFKEEPFFPINGEEWFKIFNFDVNRIYESRGSYYPKTHKMDLPYLSFMRDQFTYPSIRNHEMAHAIHIGILGPNVCPYVSEHEGELIADLVGASFSATSGDIYYDMPHEPNPNRFKYHDWYDRWIEEMSQSPFYFCVACIKADLIYNCALIVYRQHLLEQK